MDIWNDNSNLRRWLLPSVGSCNRSLLYFYEKLCPDTQLWYPIRRGLVVLPKAEENTCTTQVRGYGYCTETNQHKVLRIMEKPRSWRRIGFVPYSYYDNVFLPSWSLSMELCIGLLHTPKFFLIRFVLLESVTSKIDKFPTIPPCNFRTAPSTLRVQDCLVVCHLGSSYDGHLNIWLVKDYNGNEAWTRSCCISKAQRRSIRIFMACTKKTFEILFIARNITRSLGLTASSTR